MKLCLLFIMSFAISSVFSQREYRGKVTDANTKLPLAGATVVCGNQHILTDSNGLFLFKTDDNANRIKISYIGYQDKIIRIDSVSNNKLMWIRLNPKPAELGDVVVGSDIEKLIQKCVDKIPENYPVDSLILEGVLHLNFRTEQANSTAYKRTAIDAAIETVYPNNGNNGILPKVYLIENRNKTENSTTQLRDTTMHVKAWYLPTDIVYARQLFLERKSVQDYTYRLQSTSIWNGRTVFNIAFESKKENKLKGFVLIDTASYAFVYFDYWAYNIKELFFRTITQTHRRIAYSPLKNKWYLEQEEISNDYKLIAKETISHTIKLYKTIAVKNEKDVTLTNRDEIDLNKEARSYSKYVSDTGWSKYDTIIKALKNINDDSLAIAINDNTATGTDKDNSNHIANAYRQFATWLAYIDFGFVFTKLPVSFRGYQAGLGKRITPVSEYAYKLSLTYKIHKSYFVEYAIAGNFGIGGVKATQYGLSFGQTISLSKTQRLAPVLGYSHIFLKDKSSGQKANDGYINVGLRYLPKLTPHISLLFEGDYSKRVIQGNNPLIETHNTGYSASVGVVFNRF